MSAAEATAQQEHDAARAEDAIMQACEGGEEQSTPTFFAERDEVQQLLQDLTAKCPKGTYEIVPQEEAALFGKLETILVRYQEAPQLIKHHLQDLLNPLVEMLIERMPPAAQLMEMEAKAQKDAEEKRKLAEQVGSTEHALGKDYFEYDMDADKTTLHTVARALYYVAKVAGHKSCTSYFPHDVKHMEDVIYTLLHWQRMPNLHREWEVRYCLLLWLSNLILVPFALHTIDSANATDGDDSLSMRILKCAMGFLGDPSKSRDGAALLVARIMARPDAPKLRRHFFDFAKETIQKCDAESKDLGGNQFLPGGVLLAVATAFKLGKREELLEYAIELIPIVAPVALTFNDAVVCKTAIKTIQRLGLSALKQTTAPWKYKKQVNSLEANLGGDGSGAAAASGNEEADDGDDIEVPDVIEDVLDVLLNALSHNDTIVRWSAAKGIGRICDRLGKSGADDVVQAILDMPFEVYENDSGWHGGCLAVAELCRRSALLPPRFDDVVPIVAKALLYDVSKGSYSVGSHVRDAACYVCWSVARAYDPSDLQPYVERLSQSLVIASLFDREVNVRRASAAAFQECVGRLGNFPHGIDLITTMDFFSLASLRNAYLTVAPKVGQYAAYLPTMMEHLSSCKLFHWDRQVRRTAAAAIGLLAPLCPRDQILNELFPTLLKKAFDVYITVRHGAIFAISEIIANLPDDCWSDEQVNSIISITPTLESRRLFRGRGGEFVRQACCSLLQNVALKKLKVPDYIMVEKVNGDKAKAMTHGKIQQFFDDSMKQLLEWLQNETIDAFKCYSATYHCNFTETFHAKMLNKVIEGTAESKAPNERRGTILAMGAISRTLQSAKHAASGETFYVFFTKRLCALTKLEIEKDAQDAESRRNAVRALRWLCTSAPPVVLSEGTKEEEATSLHTTLLEFVADALVDAANDYAADKRGDVGSFVRVEAMGTFKDIVLHCLGLNNAGPSIVSPRVMTLFLQTILKQAVEKIDRVRGVAGTCLSSFFSELKSLPDGGAAAQALISEFDVISNIAGSDIVDWSSPTETFDIMVPQLLQTTTYCTTTMEGLVVSVGGMSVHVLKASWNSLLAAVDATPESAERLSGTITEVWKKYEHNDRMVVPLSITVDKLFNAGKFATAKHGVDILDMMKTESKFFSTDIQKVLPMVPLIASLCRVVDNDATRTGAWHLALMMVASRYPKVRARMGSEFYTALLVMSTSSNANLAEGVDVSAAMDKLIGTQWDDPSAPLVRGARDALYPALGLEKPQQDASEVGKKTKEKVTDGTYTALVREAGY